MSDISQDFSKQWTKASRPLTFAVPIAIIALAVSLFNLVAYQSAIGRAKQSISTAASTLIRPASTDGDDPTAPATVDTSTIDKSILSMTAAVDSQNSGRMVAEILTLLALLYLVYALVRLRSAGDGLRHTYEEAVASRDGRINFLQKDRSLLVSTMNSIGDALVACDPGGRVTFINPIAEKLTGWQEADALGKEIGRVVIALNEKTQEKMELPVTLVLKNNIDKEIPANVLVSTRDGAAKPIVGHAVPVWDDDGHVTGAALVFRDVSEKRGAREAIRTSEAHREAVIENALECVIMMDSSGNVIEFNAAAEKTFGYGRGEALGRPVADLIVPPALRDRHTAGFKRYLQTRQPSILGKRVEMTGVRKDGKEIPIELAITEVPRQDPPVFATFLRDISDRKAAEAALVAAKEEAEAQSRDKSQFLNNMSDELRTPLNAVIGYSEMLQEEINERRPLDMVPDLKKINEAGRHLLMLVTDVLDLSRIEAGKMEVFPDTFEVLDLVEDVIGTARSMAARNKNNFKITCGDRLGPMHSDRHKIRQSILYLVNNACKFAHERDLELSVERKGTTLLFRMVDLSPGIADDTTEQLADALASANASGSIRFGGHGLGLVIAKHLCEMLGGNLKGERRVGHSPVYTIELPDKAPVN